MLSAGSWVFLFFHQHKFHAAFGAISRVIHHDLGVHHTGVFAFLVSVIVLVCQAIGVNRPYLRDRAARAECDCAD
jgi:hypothetical protein